MADRTPLSVTDLRAGCLCLAVLTYGLCSQPTPDHAGPAEALVAFLLIAALPVPLLWRRLKDWRTERLFPFEMAALALLAYGLTVPLLTGFLAGHGVALILRDLIPFLFWMTPLLYLSLFETAARRRALLFCVLAGALALSVRAPDVGYWLGGSPDTALLFLANQPTVLFCALFLTGAACLALYRPPVLKPYHLPLACLALGLAAFPLIAMGLSLQRASFGALALFLLALTLAGLIRRPGRTMLILCAGMLFVGLLEILATPLLGQLLHKTSLVGFNMRFEEAATVVAALDGQPLSTLFGAGWGATILSPAVGEARVNFTHSLITASLLKTGMIGLVLVLTYIAFVIKALVRKALTDPVRVLALLAPLMIDVFLYATYKSLDFGLILLLCVATASSAANEVASRDGTVYQDKVPE